MLEVKNLSTYFYVEDGELRAVDGLSYHVDKGEAVGLVGESACGKSVSALSLMRLVPYPPGVIMGGEVIFKGTDLLAISEDEIRTIRGGQITIVFQEPTTSLNPLFSIKTQISEALTLHRNMDSQAAADESVRLLKQVGIPDPERRVNNYPHHFSGGMQQRIMLAMALACNPELLIADEPTTSVDVTVQAQLLELIDNLRTEYGTAVIIITHNLGVIARYVDRVHVMYAGRLVEVAETRPLFAEPLHPYTAGLLSSVPRLDLPRERELYVIGGAPPNLARLPSGCAFHPRCQYTINRCREERPELEEVREGRYSACFRSREMPELRKS